MMMRARRFACCVRNREISIDFDETEHERMMTYDGLETCFLNSQSYLNGFAPDYLDDQEISCSSSQNASVSSFSHGTFKRENEKADVWGSLLSPKSFGNEKKPAYTTQFSEVEAIKEKFAKLLLGQDVKGGGKSIGSALALSNAITDLAATVFGELLKLEPIPEERKIKWRKEMEWLISPANHMIELVPAQQNGPNGRSFEIMTPKARADIKMNLPALQKLDSILIETLDSVVGIEFWYEHNIKEERRASNKWQSRSCLLPYPQVHVHGLSNTSRKKLLSLGNVVQQVFKAANSINENVLHEMTVPKVIQNAFPKSRRLCLGEELYKVIASESDSLSQNVYTLKLKSEHEALDTINKLETAVLVWNERIKELEVSSKKMPLRTSWSSFMKEPVSEMDKIESELFRIDALMHQVKMRYPCLPHTFIDVTKIRYGEDIGHSILEAYSRVLRNLAYSILSRIEEILEEDGLSNPDSPLPTCCFSSGLSPNGMLRSPIFKPRVKHSLLDQMNKVDGYYFSDSNPSRSPDSEHSSTSGTCKYNSSVTETPTSSRKWCVAKDEFNHGSPYSY